MADKDILNRLEDALKLAEKLGASGAAVGYGRSEQMDMSVRQNDGEFTPSRSVDEGMILQVFVGKRSAVTSISTLKQDDLRDAVRAAVESAKFVTENEYVRLAEPSETAGAVVALDVYDSTRPTIDDLRTGALAVEKEALLNPQVTNSEGGSASWGESIRAMMTTNGFSGFYKRSNNSLSVSVIAGVGDGMVREGDYSSAIYRVDLRAASDIGAKAAFDAARKLGAKQAVSGHYPVVFSPDIGPMIMREFLSAAAGQAIMRGQSFLHDKLGQQIFDSGITIIDDPLIDRGLGSRPFDGDGVPGKRLALVENGVLKTWFMDIESAGRIGMKTTGHAGGLSNVFIQAGTKTPVQLMADIKQGLYVTGLMGHSNTALTGDFSLGAEGFWIENGQIAYPVNEITVAGKLEDMFMSLEAANDLDMRRSSATTPTLRIQSMSIGGS